jgi:hypothetical protein
MMLLLELGGEPVAFPESDGKACRLVQRKSDLDHYLEMGDIAVLDIAARLYHLEPLQVMQSLRGFLDGISIGVVDAGRGRSGELDQFVDVVAHRGLLAKIRVLRAQKADFRRCAVAFMATPVHRCGLTGKNPSSGNARPLACPCSP